jgi:hypothetical protein
MTVKTNNKIAETSKPGNSFKRYLSLKLATAALLSAPLLASAGTWTPLTNQPTFLNPPSQCAIYHNPLCAPSGQYSYGGVLAANLLTNGSVLVEGIVVDDTGNFKFVEYKLTPDIYGNYVNGTWSQVASLPDAFDSATNVTGWGPETLNGGIMPDGRVLYQGGEYSGNVPRNNVIGAPLGYGFALDGRGAIYDPVADTWTPLPPPNSQNLYPAVAPVLSGWNSVYSYPRYPFPFTGDLVNAIGDSPATFLADGRYMVGPKLSEQTFILDANTLTWTSTGTGKNDVNAESGWTLLPNGKVLSIDVYISYWFGLIPAYPGGGENAQLYDPTTGEWTSAGFTPSALSDFPDGEIGPAVLMADGRVWATGSNGNTALYNYKTNQWSPGPTFPTTTFNNQTLQLGANDVGAAVLPNGNVLIGADTYGEGAPTVFFEFDGNSLIPEPAIPNSSIVGGVIMLELPSGQILEFDETTDVEIYTPSNAIKNNHLSRYYVPVILSAPHNVQPNQSYLLAGKGLNGVSQGAMYGDDWQTATNYPLVRITNQKTGHVFYSRTYDFSSMAVASSDTVTTKFEVPASQEHGPSNLEVVTNGIPSKPVHINVK